MFDRNEIDARMHRCDLALLGSVKIPKPPVVAPRTYNVGPATMKRIFMANGITNVSDWQSILDAVEAALTE